MAPQRERIQKESQWVLKKAERDMPKFICIEDSGGSVHHSDGRRSFGKFNPKLEDLLQSRRQYKTLAMKHDIESSGGVGGEGKRRKGEVLRRDGGEGTPAKRRKI